MKDLLVFGTGGWDGWEVAVVMECGVGSNVIITG